MANFASLGQIQAYLPQTDASSEDVLTECLTRATDIVRQAMRACLGDGAFDYVAFGTASTKIVLGTRGPYLSIPPHQAGSVTLVEELSGIDPETYTALTDQWLQENGFLYRLAGWHRSLSGFPARFRVTAVWGYGATVPAAIEELTLELAVNIWRQKDAGLFQTTIGADGGGSLRYVGGLNKQQLMMLESVCQSLRGLAI